MNGCTSMSIKLKFAHTPCHPCADGEAKMKKDNMRVYAARLTD